MSHVTVAQRLAEHREAFRTAAFGHQPHASLLCDATIAASNQDLEQEFRANAPAIAAAGVRQVDAERISAAIREFCQDLPFSEVLEAERHVRAAAKAIEHAEPETLISARVLHVERRARRVSVIRLLADQPLRYASGQYVPVSDHFGSRRYFFPAIPANESGQVEFHIFGETTARLGDRWLIGEGRGGFRFDPNRDNLLIAHSTGFAALRSLLLELFSQPDPPRTHLAFAAEYPGELYELASLWQIASAAPWLIVMPIVSNPVDEWWVGATSHSKPPRGLHLPQHGQAGEVLAGFGSWGDRNILIAGPQEQVQQSRAALIQVGAPPAQISSQDFTFRPFWRSSATEF
ncbi:ferredoxin reductase domain-containing protein [Corynebacterium gerontici]|uniref:NAD(P)H-flavin reductase n=1 Tax=Corynebacterium gerontici TaxID=2079234 RepID=A0A3G6IY57_9CORY|nr:oxidoreductase [Corynebacterium gerontici]AZA10587.1 NAD(P)H-flavin reductase [Corynebacterium gerontici]